MSLERSRGQLEARHFIEVYEREVKNAQAPPLSGFIHVTLDEIRCSSARRVRKPRLAFQQT
jgi:hypothetical protein